MNRYRSTTLTRVGVVGLVLVLAVILAGIQFQSYWALSPGVRYQAVFAEAGGLRDGDSVNMAGVKIGVVQQLELNNGYAHATFTVEDGVRLGTRTAVAIKTESLLGKRMLVVISDGPGQLHPADTIPLERTSSPYSLVDAVDDLSSNVAGIDSTQLNKALDTMSSTLDQVSPELGPTFEGLSAISTSINARDESLRDLLDEAADVSSILSEQSAKVNGLIIGGDQLMGELDRRRQQIVGLLTATTEVSRQLNTFVADNEVQLAPTLERLNRVIAVLESNRDNIARAIPGMANFATSVGEAVGDGPYYNALIGNLLPGQLVQPFLNSAFGLPPEPFPLPKPPEQR